MTKGEIGVDCISRADVLKLMQENWFTHDGDWAMQESMDDIRALPSVTPQEPKWIPLKYDENDILINYPDDGQETLVTDGKDVWIDTWCQDICEGTSYAYLDNSDIGDIKAWMPLPKPYEPQESERNHAEKDSATMQ